MLENSPIGSAVTKVKDEYLGSDSVAEVKKKFVTFCTDIATKYKKEDLEGEFGFLFNAFAPKIATDLSRDFIEMFSVLNAIDSFAKVKGDNSPFHEQIADELVNISLMTNGEEEREEVMTLLISAVLSAMKETLIEDGNQIEMSSFVENLKKRFKETVIEIKKD